MCCLGLPEHHLVHRVDQTGSGPSSDWLGNAAAGCVLYVMARRRKVTCSIFTHTVTVVKVRTFLSAHAAWASVCLGIQVLVSWRHWPVDGQAHLWRCRQQTTLLAALEATTVQPAGRPRSRMALAGFGQPEAAKPGVPLHTGPAARMAAEAAAAKSQAPVGLETEDSVDDKCVLSPSPDLAHAFQSPLLFSPREGLNVAAMGPDHTLTHNCCLNGPACIHPCQRCKGWRALLLLSCV